MLLCKCKNWHLGLTHPYLQVFLLVTSSIRLNYAGSDLLASNKWSTDNFESIPIDHMTFQSKLYYYCKEVICNSYYDWSSLFTVMPPKGLMMDGKQSSNGGEKIPTLTGGVVTADAKPPAGDYYTGYAQPPPSAGFQPTFSTRPVPGQYPPAYPPAASAPYYPPNTRPPY